MKNFAFLLLLLLPALTFGQVRLKRCVLATSGGGGTAHGINVRSTLGQPPNAGTGVGNTLKARQGFQQPLSDGCASAATAAFDAAEVPSGTCGTSYDFTYTGTGDETATYAWDFGLMGFPMVSSDPDPTGVTFSQPGNYVVRLTVTTGECSTTANQEISVSDVGLGVNPAIEPITCANSGIGGVELNVTGGTAPFNYLWSDGSTDAELTRVNPGTYSYTVTDANGCIRMNTIDLTGNDSIAISTDVTVESCFGTGDGSIVANVTGGVAPYDYAWSNGATTPELLDVGGGSYRLTVTDAVGCQVETTGLNVSIACDDSIPTVISPNGDGVNDTWVIPGLENMGIRTLEIFNRWGQPIYTQDGYDNSWGGTNNSAEDLPFGPYYYVFTMDDGTERGGSITIVR